MSAFTLALKQVAGIDVEEFRNLRSYYACGMSYQEALKSKGRRRSSASASSTKSSSGVSSLIDDDIDKPSTETPTLPRTVADSQCDEKVNETSTTTSKLPCTSSSKPDSAVGSSSEEEVAGPSTQEFHAPPNVNIAEKIAKPRMTFTTNLRIMYQGRDILNIERNTQPHKWQLTSPLPGLSQRCPIFRNCSRCENFTLSKEYKMQTCNVCGFYQPAAHQNR